MKSCPYCREEVRDDAIKCRYCQSNLLSVSVSAVVTPSDDRRVTYIVDTDLIRFAKFAAAVFAIFLVVGVYLYGAKLEASLERMQHLQKEFDTTSTELQKSRADFQAGKTALTGLKSEVEAMLVEAKATLVDIREQKATAVAVVLSMRRELTPGQQAEVVSVKAAEPGKIGTKGKYWKAGSTLRIRFLGGTLEQQKSARLALLDWGQYANLIFSFVADEPSDVRVAFDPTAGSWSYVGTDALVISKNERTVNFGFPSPANLLHEWGHALGLIEEHQNPKSNIQWNMALIQVELSGPPYFWTRAAIDAQFAKVPPDELGDYRDFDPLSVMSTALPPKWTGGVALGGNTKLSESDKALIRHLYPKAGS